MFSLCSLHITKLKALPRRYLIRARGSPSGSTNFILTRGQALSRCHCSAYRMRKCSTETSCLSKGAAARLCSLSPWQKQVSRAGRLPVYHQLENYLMEKLPLLEQTHIFKCFNNYLFSANVFKIGWPVKSGPS